MKAYERLLTHCSSEQAPWYVIPSDRKWYRNLAVAAVLVEAIASLRCQYPRPKIDLRRLPF
jgi:polyphosphate kinase 2 (PPK2 family)